ncbi:hypothetical protein KAFR_0G03130 [Kazachstania africana CBS 2517]|uniref:Uncharacterized protein n=1 Tax=Kazachstania africana (strain ATCC 22294 / BCRC 22015 / CBS 2517 / CECT 1963 / NBRC 1671 / NRRL Y-8276) TaxID=1071382 RepID=H2AY95_KAZAF|nr:hypothetical protein KAFR_0G03130 [Kazachstania africana CBS 2517]CCF59345.1 hypothetical protein KAFR_0G03130 [Kazachstania africana CBS 2517]
MSITTTATTTITTTTAKTTPKLTGWAQAASRFIPKQRQQQPHHHNNHGHNQTVNVAKQQQQSSNKKTNKKHNISRQPYNRDEVRQFMKDLYSEFTVQKSVQEYNNIVNTHDSTAINPSNWDIVSNNKNKSKNKKYACLNDIAKILKN